MDSSPVRLAIFVAALATSVGGCHKGADKGSAPAPPASASGSVADALPIPAEKVRAVVDPDGRPPYSGPVGAIEGTIRVDGDAAPDQPAVLAKIDEACRLARPVYGKVFREGDGRTLADAMVAVTGYNGYLPARSPNAVVRAKGCAWESRTVAIMFGQRLDVKSADGRPYLPELLGAHMASQMVAIPGGSAIKLYAPQPGRYVLTDTLHPFMFADVLVVKYPTTAVTGLDGKYRIDGIPAGKVKVNAFLPAIMTKSEQEVTVQSAQTQTVDLVIHFDRAAYEAAQPKPAPASSAPPPIH